MVAINSVRKGRGSVRDGLERSLGRLCESLGGAFPKAGQILSTRADLVPEKSRESLCELQDNVTPLSEQSTKAMLAKSGVGNALCSIDLHPVASATVAQVHKANRSDDGRTVVVKVIRPRVKTRLVADCRIIRCLGRLMAKLPGMSSIPVNEALAEASNVLVHQTDFRLEARNHLRLQRLFANSNGVLIPRLHEELCTDNALVMDFIPGMKKISDPSLSESKAKEAITIGVRALFKMIFEDGFIHCDLHPGNVLVAPDGRLVILDAGFMVKLADEVRRSFAHFFLAIALRDGSTAATIVRKTAQRLPADLNTTAFDQDISELIHRFGGLNARDFQITQFVGELFAIMRLHRIHGTSQFTLIILSLLVYEGVTKQRSPDLDFQQEAIPFVMAALTSQ